MWHAPHHRKNRPHRRPGRPGAPQQTSPHRVGGGTDLLRRAGRRRGAQDAGRPGVGPCCAAAALEAQPEAAADGPGAGRRRQAGKPADQSQPPRLHHYEGLNSAGTSTSQGKCRDQAPSSSPWVASAPHHRLSTYPRELLETFAVGQILGTSGSWQTLPDLLKPVRPGELSIMVVPLKEVRLDSKGIPSHISGTSHKITDSEVNAPVTLP